MHTVLLTNLVALCRYHGRFGLVQFDSHGGLSEVCTSICENMDIRMQVENMDITVSNSLTGCSEDWPKGCANL